MCTLMTVLVIAVAVPSGLVCWAQTTEPPRGEVAHPAGMVVSGHPLATEAGASMLRQGGNAADAAVAIGFALAVVLPRAGNVGGGGFAVLRAPDGAVSSLDFREVAPLAATEDLYLDEEGEVALLQRVRLPRAQALVALVNDAITAEVLEDRGATDELDPQKRAMRSYAESGEAWVVLDAEALELRVPMAPREAAEFVRGLTRLAFEDTSEDAAPWARLAWAATGRALFEGLGALGQIVGEEERGGGPGHLERGGQLARALGRADPKE